MRAVLEYLGLCRAKAKSVWPAAFDGPLTHYVYANQPQPDGWGAGRYAFETLALAPHSPIDGAVRVRRQISYPFTGPQVWAGQSVRTNPIPSQHGGIYTGGMLQPDGSLPKLGTYSAIDDTAVALNDPTASSNDASQVYGYNDPAGGI